MRRIAAILIVFIVFFAAIATKPFRGHLYDYKGKPIKTAKVYVHDPKKYVKTNKEGAFYLDSVRPDDTIYVRWRGYIYDIPVDSNKGISVKFEKDYPKRKAFVNTGMGQVDARQYNGPYDVRTAKQLEATGESNLIMAMRNIVGVHVNYDKSGSPRLSIRGGGNPLWIVDGVEMTDFPDLTVMEVEKVEILKDGAGYGSRAMGGVVIVTTKGSGFYNPEEDEK